MDRDWVKFPELTNSEMDTFYWDSPHKQINEDFSCKVVKVIDGDTIRVKWDERDFDFPIRLLGIDSKELDDGGKEAQSFLESEILGEEVDIIIDPKQRVGKWGRILGKVISSGLDMGDLMINQGLATTFEGRAEGKLPDFDKLVPGL